MLRIKNNLGWVVVLVLSFSPILFWIAVKPISVRFISPATTLTSLGQITGLVGMAMFAVVLILSGRFKFLEDYFGGLNKIYFAHHFFGGLAFILMLFHPLFLTGKYLFVSPTSAALFLLPGDNWPINFGIFGLLLLIILLVATFFVKLPYGKWKFSHKFLGLAFFLVGIHSFLIPSDISRFLPLRIYMFSLTTTGILVYGYRTILGFVLVEKFTYVISKIKYLGEKVVEIEMSPQDKILKFKAGQFVFTSFQDKNIGTEAHPFSLSSSPLDKNLKIAVKNLGDFTEKIKNIKIGTTVKIEGPFGRFFSQNGKEQIWIAGGIGITPFLSMARESKQGQANNNIFLFYCVQDKNEAVFFKEFSEISTYFKNFKFFPFYTNTRGHLTTEYIKKAVGELDNKEIFICGPPTMMKSLTNQFLESGVARKNIHSEEFQF